MKKSMFLFCFLFLIGLCIYAQKPKADFDVVVTYNCYYATTKYINKSEGAVRYYWKYDGMSNFYERFEPVGSNIGDEVSFTTTLIAVASDGQSDTIEKRIDIAPTKVRIKYTPVDSSLIAPATIQFFNDSYIRQGEDSLSYKWAFGYGVETTEKNPIYTFLNPGTYSVSLTGKTAVCDRMAHEMIVVKDTAQRGEFSFVKLGCNQDYYIASPCGSGKHYQILNDTLKVLGTYRGNCGATKTATIRYKGDTILIRTWETGPLTTCDCEFCFEINIPHYSKDSAIIFFNGERIKSTVDAIPQINRLDQSIRIYPNPVFDNFLLETDDNSIFPLELVIKDIAGRKVYETNLNTSNVNVNTSEWKSGVYVLYLYSKLWFVTKKIMKI